MRIFKRIFLLLLIVLIIAQFFGPKKNHGELASIDAFYEDTNPTENIKIILKDACIDCHSDVTKYPWYFSVTPVNYWMAEHVNDAKKHFNFSNWEGNSVKRKDHKFEELIEMVEDKEMPLPSYTWTHSEAKLSEDQINDILEWAKLVRIKYSLAPKPQ